MAIAAARSCAEFQLQPQIVGFANFSFQDDAQNNLGVEFDIPNIARVKGNIGLTASIPGLMAVTAIGNWVGRRDTPATNPLGAVNPYFITNLAVATESFFGGRVRLNLAIQNLFDQEYNDPGIRSGNGQRFYATVHEQPGLQARIKVILNY